MEIRRSDTEEKLRHLFFVTGLPVSGRGYPILLEALRLVEENPDRLQNMNIGIYIPIAEKYHTNPGNISKALQRIRDAFWDNRKAMGILRRAGCPVYKEYEKLPPREWIGILEIYFKEN